MENYGQTNETFHDSGLFGIPEVLVLNSMLVSGIT